MFGSGSGNEDGPPRGPAPLPTSYKASVSFTDMWPASYKEASLFLSSPTTKAEQLLEKLKMGLYRRRKSDVALRPKSLNRGFMTPDIRSSSGHTPEYRRRSIKEPKSVKIPRKADIGRFSPVKAKRGPLVRSFSDDALDLPGDAAVPARHLPPTTGRSSIEGDLKERLLPKQEPEASLSVPRTSSFVQACFNAINILMGVGILSLPYAIRTAGWAGLVILALLAAMTCYTGVLLKYCQTEQIKSYPDIGASAFGKWGKIAIGFVLYVELFCTLCLFLILEAGTLFRLIPQREDADEMEVVNRYMLYVSLALLPGAYLRDMSILSFLSLLGIISTVSLIGAILFYGTTLPDHNVMAPQETHLFQDSFPISFGLIAFCFAGHAVFPNIYASMKEPEKSTKMLKVSYSLVSIAYGVTAAFGYLMYGGQGSYDSLHPNPLDMGVRPNIIYNLPQDIGGTIITALICINAYTKFALTLHPIAVGFEEFVQNWPSLPRYIYTFLMRTAIVTGAYYVAVAVPDFGKVASFIGAIMSMSVSAIFPILCYLKLYWPTVTWPSVILNIVMIIVSVVVAASGTWAAVSGKSGGA